MIFLSAGNIGAQDYMWLGVCLKRYIFFSPLFFIIILLLYWGYIVTFTKVLTIYHSWIHPSIILLILYSWNSFNRSHFSIFILFSPPSPFYTLSLYPPLPTGTNPPDRTCYTFLFSVSEKKDIFVYLYREFPCDISMYICIITWTGSSRVFLKRYILTLAFSCYLLCSRLL
jgi:hypothetical protein